MEGESLEAELTHHRAGGDRAQQEAVGRGARAEVRLCRRGGRGDALGCPGGKLERGGREGASLKGTGRSEGEGPASDQMVVPQMCWTLRFGDPPGLNLQNGSLASSILQSQNYFIRMQVPPFPS